MVNKGILLENLIDKFHSLTLHSIVNECFINGLPLEQSEISRNEKVELTKYSYKVLESINGFQSMMDALESSTSLSNPQKILLYDIYSICTEASKEAANRIVKETDCSDKKTNMTDIVDSATFTESEYKAFMTKANNLNLDKISNIIKEKTLNVIKDEQEHYEKEEELDNELKDALSNSKDFSDVSTEAYMNIVLTKSDPRKHVTVFSKLQDAAMEMMAITPVSDETTGIMNIVDKVTFSSFVDDFMRNDITFSSCNESFTDMNSENNSLIDEKSRAKLSLVISIVVYTVMETLKTLNIYCPSKDAIKKFVSSKIDGNKLENKETNEILTRAMEMIKKTNTTDLSKVNSIQLANDLSKFKEIQETLESVITLEGQENKNKIYNALSAIESHTLKIEGILNQRNNMLKNSKATESITYYDNLSHENDITQFNKINRLYGKNPLVSEIHLKINPATESIIDVNAVDNFGQTIKKSFMNIQSAVESSSYLEYLNNLYKESDLNKTDKNVFIVPNDGSGRKIKL